ncbi:hypothetical protein GLW03_07675 [Halobacillus halophilus]|uniref:hypothetical protein n=1 Tax=Halobacillus halophilus TaxID=1570 RepID=UPI00136E9B07|nr:hypothetical protein [Halobacillus halophilus]MYL29699.1 hypothetical protein [Halobacillus halophilus]
MNVLEKVLYSFVIAISVILLNFIYEFVVSQFGNLNAPTSILDYIKIGIQTFVSAFVVLLFIKPKKE